MKYGVFVIFFFIFFLGCNQPKEESRVDFSDVELFEVIRSGDKRFDLSGIVHFNSSIIAVADKPWNKFLYKINPDTTLNKATTEEIFSLTYEFKSDFEAVDYADSVFYIADERSSEIYTYDLRKAEMRVLNLGWPQNIVRGNWGNAGLEAIAVDKDNGRLFIGKERDEAALFVSSISGGVTEPINMEDFPEGFDVSDMKYENHHLYLLNRGNYRVIKWDTSTGKIIDYFDYSFVMNANGEKLYSSSRYPMAEGLSLTSDHIWLALDNNGDSFNNDNPWIEMSKFAGENPLLVRFNRPEGF
ncbi:MAG TPA: SdiA-regulated domain-containing protein [Bacteroidales bacterium]|nr:SdiA-regulated domain-containing protein [Bacteroidales bacterium]